MISAHNDSQLALSPGRALGEFRLGESLYSILALLRYKPIISTSSITVHSDDEALRSDVYVRLSPSTVDLKFDGITQRLCSITMSLPTISFDVVYNSNVIIPRNTTLSRTQAGVLFGPCRSDTLNQWPGMIWDFSQGESSSVTVSTSPTPVLDGKIAEIVIIPKKSISVVFTGQTHLQHNLKLSQSTAADLVSLLGPPEQTFEKRDKRLGAYATDDDNDQYKGVFYNYPSLGLDVLVNSVNHKVEKFILHSNVPATPLFQAYNRCMWRIELPDESASMQKTTSSNSNGSERHSGSNGKANGKRNKEMKESKESKVDEHRKQILFTDKIDTIMSKLSKEVQIDKMVLDKAHEVGLKDWDESMRMMELISVDVLGAIMEVTSKGDVCSLCIHE
ncbi:hypothetical protein E3P99_03447 [Wallemia hederae]|uniref:Uncharacterized protein n=1 Tax=Wallemia hederae TaxID=1540922 RepID=A0A4T0FJX5_9BASI|nr:hypothetical protein E3P99_03447 [Wallemia hederae]